jgi:hypothetical protein
MRIILLLMLVYTLPLSAQYKVRTTEKDYIRQGMFTMGGNLSFSNQTFEASDNDRTIISFSPAVFYFLFQRLSVGLSAGFNNLSSGGTSTTDWGIGPSVRYYLSVKKFAPFAGAGISYGASTSSASDDKYTTQKIILSAGADYFLVSNVAIEMILNYMFIRERYPDRFSEFLPKLEFTSRQAVIALGVNIFI